MLSWEDVRYLKEKGVTFGSETMTHPNLSNMLIDDAKEEILKPKKILEEKLGVEIKHFAVPNGREQDFTEELRQYCKDAGYQSIQMDIYGADFGEDDIWKLKRVNPIRPFPVFAFEVVRLLLRKSS